MQHQAVGTAHLQIAITRHLFAHTLADWFILSCDTTHSVSAFIFEDLNPDVTAFEQPNLIAAGALPTGRDARNLMCYSDLCASNRRMHWEVLIQECKTRSHSPSQIYKCVHGTLRIWTLALSLRRRKAPPGLSELRSSSDQETSTFHPPDQPWIDTPVHVLLTRRIRTCVSIHQ